MAPTRSRRSTAQINQWDGCPAGYLWADQLCAGGAGFLQACPADKGAPLLEEDTLVGIASGPSCDGAVDNYGAFVKVADKGILEQVSVWLNNRCAGAVRRWVGVKYPVLGAVPGGRSGGLQQAVAHRSAFPPCCRVQGRRGAQPGGAGVDDCCQQVHLRVLSD